MLSEEDKLLYSAINGKLMSGLLNGKVALVTGGSKGIGFSIAERFVKEGARVVICSRNESELSSAASNLECDYYSLDVSNSQEIKSMVSWISKKYSNLDILVNSAGVVRYGNVVDASEEDWDFQTVSYTHLRAHET